MPTRCLLLCLIIGVVTAHPRTPSHAQSTEHIAIYLPLVTTSLDFAAVSQDLMDMNQAGLFGYTSSGLVTFAADTANQQGFGTTSVALATDLTAFSNDLIVAAAEAPNNPDIIAQTYAKAETYIAMSRYWAAAAQPENHYTGAVPEPPAEQPLGDSKPILIYPEIVCGIYWNPRPHPAARWVSDIPSANPSATLTSMGFHAPPSWLPQIGWTRNRTYWPALCGFATFRDNASIGGPTLYNLQDYSTSGLVPAGEPNPEVWQSGPWPYPTWPAYVYWWHRTY